MSLKRLISITTVCLLGVLALSGSQAAAQQPDDTFAKVECDFLLNSVAGTASGVNSVATDTGQGQSYDPLSTKDTDPGTFTFSGRAYCKGEDEASEWVDKGGGIGLEAISQNVLITAKGIYDNLYCGTADAKGTAVLVDVLPRPGQIPPDPPNITNHDLEVHMQFAMQLKEGAGGMSIVIQGAPAEAGQGTHSYIGRNQIDQGQGIGGVALTPTKGNCIGTPGVQKSGDVTEFLLNGGFDTSLSGEGQTVIDPTSDSDQ